MTSHCANCGAFLNGPYCSDCGQRRFVESDRRLGRLFHQFVESATDVDGRFWGSLRALLFQPGRLSRDYVAGKRARWMPPVGLFLLVNVVYFLFAQDSDFATPFSWEVPGRIVVAASDPGQYDEADVERLLADPGPLHSRLTAQLVDRRVAARRAAETEGGEPGDYDYRDYRQAYDAKVPEVSKALAVLHVPFLAIVLMLMFRGRYYAEHFVVVLHLLAFDMAVIQLLVHGMNLVHVALPPADWHSDLLNWAVRIILTTYIILALRRVYEVPWLGAVAATAGFLIAYVLINFYLYRPLLFLTVFSLT